MEGNNKPVEVPHDLIDQSKALVIDTARFLRIIRDEHPDEFQATAKKMKIGPRKAHHLAQIDTKLGELNIAAERVRHLGWTKLAILAAYGKAETIDDLIEVAGRCTAHKLKTYIRTGKLAPDGRTVVLHLDSEQYGLLEQALLAKGAKQEPRGLLEKEAALIRLVSESLAGAAPE